MRASSLSDPEVIGFVAQYFVPLDLGTRSRSKPATAAESAERLRIFQAAEKAGLEAGTVCIYVLAPDGAVLESLMVHQAVEKRKLLPVLKRALEKCPVQPRSREAIAASRMASPGLPQLADRDGLRLRVLTRFLAEDNGGTAENWAELSAADRAAFAPPAGAKQWQSWDIPAAVANKLYVHCFPPVSDFSSQTSEVRTANLKATLIGVRPGLAQLEFGGSLDMLHREANNALPPSGVALKIVGVGTYDTARKQLLSLHLISTQATYLMRWGKLEAPVEDPRPFLVAVESRS
jgi:hypothetical protein